jgi:hypothetical protein
MDIVDARDKLLEVLACLLLFQSLVLNDDIEQLASADKLHDQVEVLLSFDDLIYLYNVRVMELFEDLDFTADPLDVLLVFDT